MYRLITALIVILITVAGFFMYIKDDKGLILVSFADYQFQTSLLVFGLVCILFLIVGLGSFYFLKKVYRGLSSFGSGLRRKNQLKAKQALLDGLTLLSAGNFAEAEKTLSQFAKQSESTLLCYLGAARAAQQQGDHQRRDEHLRLAYQQAPDQELAIGLTKAELQLAHEQNEQALATLNHLYKIAPENSYVVTLLIETYQRLAAWDSMEKLLPQMNKVNNLPIDKLHSLEIIAWSGQLRSKAETGIDDLLNVWKRLPHHIKTLPEIVEQYARLLEQNDNSEEAEKVLRKQLENKWQASTIQLYAEFDVKLESKALEHVQGWLNKHPDDAWLLLALGKLCMQQQLWGKARSYLEASLSVKPLPETCLKLATLLEQHMNEDTLAQKYYRQGMHIVAGDSGNESLVKAVDDFETTIQRMNSELTSA